MGRKTVSWLFENKSQGQSDRLKTISTDVVGGTLAHIPLSLIKS